MRRPPGTGETAPQPLRFTQTGGRRHGHHGRHVSPALRLVTGFAMLILVGAVLLALPWAAADGRSIGFINALFMSTSAVCVTGLAVVDLATGLSAFGQVIILLLVQLGGLGIIIATSIIMVLLGRRIMLRDRLVLQEAMGRATPAGVVRLTREIVIVALTIEAVGALLLLIRFAGQFSFGRALWLAIFHAVSAFNNAGFDLFSVSLKGHATDPLVVLTIAGLLMVGGIGFAVINELLQPIYRWWDRRRGQSQPALNEATYALNACDHRWRLSLHSRLALSVTGILIVAGTILYLLLEWNNPATFGPLSLGYKVLAAFFSAVTPRTAGFEVVPTGAFHPATLLLTVLLMFIGASPGGTGGGIKTTSIAAILLSVRASIRGYEEVEVFNRRLPADLVNRAWVVTAISGGMCFLINAIMLLTESGQDPLHVLFEVVSAFGTVGLTAGLTMKLTAVGKLLITLMMYMGRVGPLTLAVALAERRRAGVVDFPEERVMIG